MTDIKEKFSNLIKKQNLNIFDGPFVVKNFLENVKDYCNWNTLNEAINSDIVEWELVENKKQKVPIPWNKPFSTGIRQQNKQFIIDHVNNGTTFIISRCCILNANLKSLASDIQEAFPVACDIHIYGSKGVDSKSFDYHSDRPNNFIIQADGDTDWIVFKNRICNMLPYETHSPKKEELTPSLEVTLSPGDLLYIPPRTYHAALPSMPRLSMSIPCISLDMFYYLQNYIPNLDKEISFFVPNVNKYEI